MATQTHGASGVHELVAQRWSPYGFSAREIAPADLLAMFDAAGRAPSSYNAQPWHYIVGRRGEQTFDRVLSCLVASNQAWAKHATVLALGALRTSFAHNGKPNAAAEHDLGAASATLCFEATARGISVHQMIGVDPERARTEFALPAGFRVLTALALGYPGHPDGVPADVLDRDRQRRPRRELREFVFGGTWGEAAPFVK